MGVYINRISDGSLAARDKSLTVGDRVIRINDKLMDDIEGIREAMQVLNDESTDVINITTLKMSYPECPNVFTPVRRNKKETRSSQVSKMSFLCPVWWQNPVIPRPKIGCVKMTTNTATRRETAAPG